MIRNIHDHKVNPIHDELAIAAIDSAPVGGACSAYAVVGFDVTRNASYGKVLDFCETHREGAAFVFQNGSVAEAGANGLTNEVLLAVVLDRLKCVQAGPFATPDVGNALFHTQRALEALHDHTRTTARGPGA